MAGAVAGFTGKGLGPASVFLVRFITLYTIVLALAYSAIPYKTPWCMLGFLHGLILLAGTGADALMRVLPGKLLRLATSVVLGAAAIHLTWLACQASYVYEADRRNPYVYAQTVPDTLELVDKVEALAKVHSEGHHMFIQVIAPGGDYWPLPWYLRRFDRVGWWQNLPEGPYGPVMVVGAELCRHLDAKSNNAVSPLCTYGLRPGTFLQLYVQPDLWRRYLDKRREPGPD